MTIEDFKRSFKIYAIIYGVTIVTVVGLFIADAIWRAF